jgi:myo-inositol 2-dehydrogenase/D-chiro-inositol 1-dehydrogenase
MSSTAVNELTISTETPRAELVAAYCPAEAESEIAWFTQHLAPFGVKLYNDYDEMLKHPKLQAVVVATVTTVHAEQAIKAIEADKHVLCEKPLSTSVEIVCQTCCILASG